MYAPQPQSSVISTVGSIGKAAVLIVGIVILGLAGLFIYNAVRVSQGLPSSNMFGPAVTSDQTPTAVSGQDDTVVSAGSVPLTQGSDYGVQLWMYIKDWDTNFGKEKTVLRREDPTNKAVSSPSITLHPTDNSLNVSVSIFPSGTSAGSSTPSAANDQSATGDTFTCTVENVPLQSWFSVSATVFQRNLDVYINGRLVKSCVLPGVPKPAVGDVHVGSKTSGFAGQVCNVHMYPNALTPADAMAFYSTGTSCGASTPPPSTTPKNTTAMKIFGYTFTFGVLDNAGKSVSSYTF